MRTRFYNFKVGVDFKLPSREKLFKKMGEYDTLAEYTVCALRDFEKKWDRKKKFEDYVTQKAIEHSVNLRGGVTLAHQKSSVDIYPKILLSLYMKNGESVTPLNCALKAFIVELRDSVAAFDDLSMK